MATALAKEAPVSRLFWVAVGVALGVAATITRSHDHPVPVTDPSEDGAAAFEPAESGERGGFFAPD